MLAGLLYGHWPETTLAISLFHHQQCDFAAVWLKLFGLFMVDGLQCKVYMVDSLKCKLYMVDSLR